MTTLPRYQRAALIVCGGESRRMGQSKPHLPFGNETMLERVIRIVSPLVEEVVLLTGKSQELPLLPFDYVELPDRVEQQGPAAAIYEGLKYVTGWSEAAIVLGCDLPLVTQASIEYLFEQLSSYDAVIPLHEGMPQPLAAVYANSARETFENILFSGNQRLLSCIEPLNIHWIDPRELAGVDPNLGLLRNVNTPDAYREALQIAGLKHPLED
ncbi:putative molybdenum cofactor guanylyltransferase [Bremerella volcania]|uniref:Probable molybdenum cofactor guanylyltransferase n=1 Tax=Bremerella volcania TaxID=2527984 RepID=A0A518C2V2_9BACT|nr:molybdenum cofactor guanylyltransferase [Bremerella volcania]QDU73504.1 putative molybdenum cofactor guanylyltransferase [Bremerella volcania]